MEKIIREVNTRLQQMLPAAKNHLNISDFRAAGLPEPLIDRIQLEIFQHLDRSLPLPRTDWVDMSDLSVQQAWTVFMQNLRNHSHLPSSQKADIFNNAVNAVIHQLIEPRTAIPTQLFEDEPALTYEQLLQRTQKIVVYRHLVVGLIRYMDRRNLRVLPLEKCKDVLSQIDHKFCEDYTPMNWEQLLSPWFEFFGKRIPVILLRRFFNDKRNVQLTEAFPESLVDLNKTEIIERLSAPGLPASYHKMDDPERERKLAQRIQSLENAGTYYEEFLKLRQANRQKWATIIDERVPNTKVELAEIQPENVLNRAFGEQHLNSHIAVDTEEVALNEIFTENEDESSQKTYDTTEQIEKDSQKSESQNTHENQTEAETAEEILQLLEDDSTESLNDDFENADVEAKNEDDLTSEQKAEPNKTAAEYEPEKIAADLSFHDLAEEGVLDEIDDVDDIEAMMASIQNEEDAKPTLSDELSNEDNLSLNDSISDQDELEKMLAEQEEKLRIKQQENEGLENTAPEVIEPKKEVAEPAKEEETDDNDEGFDMDALFAGNNAKDAEPEPPESEPEVIEPKKEVAEPAKEKEADGNDEDFDMDALFAGNNAKDAEPEPPESEPEVIEPKKEVAEPAKEEETDDNDEDFDMDALFAAKADDLGTLDHEDKPAPTKASSGDINAMFSNENDSDSDSSNGMEGLFSDEDSSIDDVLNQAARPLGENEGLLEYLSDYHDYFIRELFDGSVEAFSQCVEDVDSFDQWAEASEYLNNDIFSAYGIDMISEPAIKLIDELQTYFSSYKGK